MRERPALPLAVGLVAIVVLAVWLIGGAPIRDPLDPRSHEPSGTSALVALLDELGADTSINVEQIDDDTDTALLLADQLDEDETDTLADWVDAGGTLVVTDPGSSFVPASRGLYGLLERDSEALRNEEPVSVSADDCDVTPFVEQDLDSLAVMGGPIRYEVGAGDQSCFGDGDEAFVVVTEVGDGHIVAFGGSGSVINRTLDQDDNAPAIAGVLAPREGTKVAVFDVSRAGSSTGDEALMDVMPTWAKRVLAQLGIAFLVYVLWRARRLGKPVAEPQPVKVAASELVAATGGLLERSRSPQYAADVLRSDLRRDLTIRLGLPRNLAPDTFAELVAARTQLDAAQLQAALGPGPVSDDADLLTVARLIDIVRKEVFVHVGS